MAMWTLEYQELVISELDACLDALKNCKDEASAAMCGSVKNPAELLRLLDFPKRAWETVKLLQYPKDVNGDLPPIPFMSFALSAIL